MIAMLQNKIPVRFLCKFFSISPSSYYLWLKSKDLKDCATVDKVNIEIKQIFNKSKKTYGSPRIHRQLKTIGHKISENTVAKYMVKLGLNAQQKKRFKVVTTDSNHKNPVAPRLFKYENKGSLPLAPGKILAGDITYIKVGCKFIYLAVVIDLFNREVVGWSIGNSLETSLVLKALHSAILKVGPDAEVIFHSDRGSQYDSEAYRNFLKNKKKQFNY
jgi:transposase InsO family protein